MKFIVFYIILISTAIFYNIAFFFTLKASKRSIPERKKFLKKLWLSIGLFILISVIILIGAIIKTEQ